MQVRQPPLPLGEGRGEGASAESPPLSTTEFATLIAPLGPFPPTRQIAAAVSGGPDSMALALLLKYWGHPTALIVDHALRPNSATEAAQTAQRLATIQIPARILRIHIPPGPNLGARARQARYDALLSACQAEGLPDLFLAHHAADQAETQLLRTRRGSGPAGRAAMAAITWRNQARLLRPLLGIPPARLRATLRAAGLAWAEDPGNTDPTTTRGALRQHPIAPFDPTPGPSRATSENTLAAELAHNVTLHPAGFARIHAPLSPEAWSALLWTLSGHPHPPPSAATRRLAQAGQGTLHNVLIRGGYAMRETPAPAIPARQGAIWDSRFHLGHTIEGATIGALGDDAPPFRARSGLPASVLRRFPALRQDGKLLAVPHLDFAAGEYWLSVGIGFRPVRPLAGAAFVPGAGCARSGDAHGAAAHHVVSGRAATPSSV